MTDISINPFINTATASKQKKETEKKPASSSPQVATRSDEQRDLPSSEVYVGQPLKLNLPEEAKVIIVDGFTEKEHKDSDSDGIIDNIAHGTMVKIMTGDKNAEELEHGRDTPFSDTLARIRHRAENGEQISAINYSGGFPMSYEDLSKGFGKEVNPENIRQLAPAIIEDIRKTLPKEMEARDKLKIEVSDLNKQLSKLNPDSTEAKQLNQQLSEINNNIAYINREEDWVNTYDEINKLAALNVPVVISSGNIETENLELGNYGVNMYTLNEKAIVIGATDSQLNVANHKSTFMAFDNSLVDARLQGIYLNDEVPNDISSQLSYQGGFDPNNPLRGGIVGTSFSAPVGTKYVAQMNNKGKSVDKINQIMSRADEIAATENLNTSTILDIIMNKM